MASSSICRLESGHAGDSMEREWEGRVVRKALLSCAALSVALLLGGCGEKKEPTLKDVINEAGKQTRDAAKEIKKEVDKTKKELSK